MVTKYPLVYIHYLSAKDYEDLLEDIKGYFAGDRLLICFFYLRCHLQVYVKTCHGGQIFVLLLIMTCASSQICQEPHLKRFYSFFRTATCFGNYQGMFTISQVSHKHVINVSLRMEYFNYGTLRETDIVVNMFVFVCYCNFCYFTSLNHTL